MYYRFILKIYSLKCPRSEFDRQKEVVTSIRTPQDILANINNRVHPNRVVCSLQNTKDLHLEFVSGDDGNMTATFQGDEAFEGYLKIFHGGIVSSILDGAMGHCMFARGQTAVTAEITTRFRHPVVISKKTAVSVRVTQSSHPLYLLETRIVQDGRVKAAAIDSLIRHSSKNPWFQ